MVFTNSDFIEKKCEINVKISDFGLSKVLPLHEKSEEWVGTLPYVAPEIAKGIPYSKSVDIWSLGIMTYFLVSRTLPFYDSNSEELMKKIITNKVVFNKTVFKDSSKTFIDFIEKCLEKDQHLRMNIDQVLSHPWFKANNIGL